MEVMRDDMEDMRILSEDMIKLKFRQLTGAISTSKLTVEVKRQINKDLTDLVDSIHEQQKLIHYYRGQLDILSKHEAESYAEVAKAKTTFKKKSLKKVREEEVFEIKVIPFGEQESEVTKKIVKEKIRPENLGIGIERCRSLGKGALLIRTEMKEDIDKLIEEFGKIEELKMSYKVQTPSKRDPRIIIYDVQEQFEKEEFQEMIKKQNEEFKEVEVITSFRTKKGANWILRIKGEDYQRVKSLKKVKLGWMRYGWKLYNKPTICFNCWRFGHIGRDCHNIKICKKCAEKEHGTEPCKRGQVCTNCENHQKRIGRKIDVAHLPTDRQCGRYLIEEERLMERTDFGSKAETALSDIDDDEFDEQREHLMARLAASPYRLSS